MIKEKKRQLDDNHKAKKELNDMQDENKQLRDKVKHLTLVIEKFHLKDSDSPNKRKKNIVVP